MSRWRKGDILGLSQSRMSLLQNQHITNLKEDVTGVKDMDIKLLTAVYKERSN